MEMLGKRADFGREDDVAAKLDGLWTYDLKWREPLDVARVLAERPGFAFSTARCSSRAGALFLHRNRAVRQFYRTRQPRGLNGAPLDAPPLDALRQLLARFAVPADPALPPFQGGVIGAVPYEFGWEFDGLRGGNHAIGQDEPVSLGFYDLVLAFDHLLRRAYVFSSGLPESDPETRAARATMRIEQVLHLIGHSPRGNSEQSQPIRGWTSNFTPTAYHAAIDQVQARIFAGDIYQANIAQRFSARLPALISRPLVSTRNCAPPIRSLSQPYLNLGGTGDRFLFARTAFAQAGARDRDAAHQRHDRSLAGDPVADPALR